MPIEQILNFIKYNGFHGRELESWRVSPNLYPKKIYLKVGGHNDPYYVQVNDFELIIVNDETNKQHRFIKPWAECVVEFLEHDTSMPNPQQRCQQYKMDYNKCRTEIKNNELQRLNRYHDSLLIK